MSETATLPETENHETHETHPEVGKATPVKEKKTKIAKADDGKVVAIQLADIKSNHDNPRESAPDLQQQGFGLFDKLEGSNKPAIVPLGLSKDASERAQYVGYVDKFDTELVEMAQSFKTDGQLQPVIVSPLKDGSGYALIIGCRRYLTALYNFAKGEGPSTINAIVKEVYDDDAQNMAFAENLHRRPLTPMEESNWYHRLQTKLKMKPEEIAKQVHKDHQVVRLRLALQKGTDEIKQLVHRGELGVVKAVELIKGKADKSDPKNMTRGGKGTKGREERRRAPTLDAFQKLYEERENLHEEVRKFIALEILGVKYVSFKELQDAKKRAEEDAARLENKKDKKDKKGSKKK